VTTDPRGCWPAEPRLLDSFDAAALLVDVEGRVVYANGTAERLYGTLASRLVGDAMLERLFTEGEQVALGAVVGQVLEGKPWQGRLEVRHGDGSLHQAGVSCSPLWRDDAVVGLLWVLDDSVGGGALREARRLGDRLTRLARVTSELVLADDVDTVTKIVVSHGADAAGATLASMSLREGQDQLRLAGLQGGREGEMQKWSTYPLSLRTPASEAVRTGQRIILNGEAAIAAAFPEMRDALNRGERSLICLPLNVATRTIGAIGLSFPGLRSWDAAELDFFEILADTCAQALDRIGAQEVAARQSAKLVFLADASTELASSLDYQVTLAKVAQLAVPTFADWCAIDVVDDGRLHRVAVAHVDPAKVRLAQELAERYPPDPDAPTGAWNVMRTGKSEWIPEITDEILVAAAVDQEQLQLARDLHLRSAVTVPLIARDRVLGVITWVSAESERLFTEEDLSLAEDLAKRAAVAIDNAELHSETLAAAVHLQHAVLPDAMPDVPGWVVASHYSPSGRTEVGGDFYDAVPLTDGRLALFVGDVMGRGVAAAAAMAQMRAAVRAFTAVDPTPQVVMANLDAMFAQFPTEQLVTLVYAVADPRRDELAVCNAGHPPPVVLRADGSTEQLPSADGAPLAVIPQHRRQVTVPFHLGDTVLAFTDGLIERRDEDIDAGQERVLGALSTLAGPDLSGALDVVVEQLRDPDRDDDVAALAARRTS
jgi:PAS domain S-box-containing protein